MLAALLAALVSVALALYADVPKLRDAVRLFSPAAFVAGLGLVAGNYALRIIRWQYYLRRIGVFIALPQSAIVFLAGLVMSVTPGKIGEVFKSLLLHDSWQVPIERSAPIVVAERLTDLIALVLLVSVGALAFEHGVAVAVSSALVVACLWLVCAYRPLGHWLLSVVDRIPGVRRLGPRLQLAYDSLQVLTRPAPLLVGSLLGLLGWSLECACLYVIAHGFAGVELSAQAATFAYASSTLAGALAMLPGGIGVTEFGMTALLHLLGGPDMQRETASATTFLVRAATLWFGVAVGALALGVYRASARQKRSDSPRV